MPVPASRTLRRTTTTTAALAAALFALPTLPAWAAGEITVLTAWYGQSCGTAHGNVTAHVQSRCTGRRTCSYPIEVQWLGDPAPGCAKNFVVLYTCSGTGTESPPVRLAQLAGESSGRSVEVSCLPPAAAASR